MGDGEEHVELGGELALLFLEGQIVDPDLGHQERPCRPLACRVVRVGGHPQGDTGQGEGRVGRFTDLPSRLLAIPAGVHRGVGRVGEVAGARTNLNAGASHGHADPPELPVRDVVRRRVAEEVVVPGLGLQLLQAAGQIIRSGDGEPAVFGREARQARAHGLLLVEGRPHVLETPLVGLQVRRAKAPDVDDVDRSIGASRGRGHEGKLTIGGVVEEALRHEDQRLASPGPAECGEGAHDRPKGPLPPLLRRLVDLGRQGLHRLGLAGRRAEGGTGATRGEAPRRSGGPRGGAVGPPGLLPEPRAARPPVHDAAEHGGIVVLGDARGFEVRDLVGAAQLRRTQALQPLEGGQEAFAVPIDATAAPDELRPSRPRRPRLPGRGPSGTPPPPPAPARHPPHSGGCRRRRRRTSAAGPSSEPTLVETRPASHGSPAAPSGA